MTRSGCNRLWLAALALCLCGAGCHGTVKWRRAERAEKKAVRESDRHEACIGDLAPLRRRVFIIDQSGGHGMFLQGNFGLELAAAFNAQPGWEAVLLPPGEPIPLCAGPVGPPAPAILPTGGAVADPTLDELLVVQVTEIHPYRPIRISAVLERRSAVDGTVLARVNRSWHAPIDDEPLWPSHFTQRILAHPPPLEVIERHELSRISPLTFARSVAAEVALEFSQRPF